MTANDVLLAASGDYSIPLAAFIVSAAALAYGIFGAGRWNRMSSIESAMNDRINDLVRQLQAAKDEHTDMRRELADCARRCKRLEGENWKLSRRLAGLESDDP
jgi:hypothetical protein